MYSKLRTELKDKFEYYEGSIIDDDVTDLAEYDLKDAISDCESFKLYRYMPAKYFNIRNIETQTVHLSPNGTMNDVFEGLPILSQDLNCFDLKQLDDLAYMVCMSETKQSTLMWSHYADNHKGICVEFDLKRLKEDPCGIISHIFPIVYRDERFPMRNIESLIDSHKLLRRAIEDEEDYSGDEALDDILPLFLIKSRDWEYEKEWRILFSKKQMYDINEKTLYAGNLSFKCISAIYLGYRIDSEVEKNIIEICKRISTKEEKISVYKERPSTDTFAIEFDLLH